MKIVKWKCIICWVNDQGDTFENDIMLRNVKSSFYMTSLSDIVSNLTFDGFHVDRFILIPCYEK